MATTLKDIARECGVAVSTVSNILNNHASSFASVEVRRRVHEATERLGYKKDYLSSSLRTRRTQSVGLILDKIDDHTRQDFLVPFVERFSERGYEVALAEHRHSADRAIGALKGFSERCKDGVVLFTDLLGAATEAQKRLSDTVRAIDLHILGVGSALKGVVPSLDIDRGGAVGRSLAELVQRGRKRLLVVYEYDWDMRPHFSYWNHPGITYWSGVHTEHDFAQRLAKVHLGDFDAVFFRTDRIAIPALGMLRERGVRVPDDLEVISFDNYPFSAHTSPSLSSWDIGFARLGRRSQELLTQWINQIPPTRNTYELFQPEFVKRNSHRE